MSFESGDSFIVSINYDNDLEFAAFHHDGIKFTSTLSLLKKDGGDETEKDPEGGDEPSGEDKPEGEETTGYY